MTSADESQVTHVASHDGTEIAYWTTGHGPPLLVVHGAFADHTRWRQLLPHLEPYFRVHAIDRRGRGGSGDGPAYDMAREFEDVAAVVDSIAQSSGCAVDVYGHSYGGFVAFGAATLTPNIRRLVLYEGWPVRDPSVFATPPELEARLEELLAEEKREALLETALREIVMLSDSEIESLRKMPSWQGRILAAHTFSRELRACAQARLDPAQAAQIKAPTLLLAGESSPDPARNEIDDLAAVLPDARAVVIEGQQHVADVMVPELFAGLLLTFFRESVIPSRR
jgi:pimeloyl-ACP methyl ester carboxylesterase